ncbi:hematopoietic progenitor cell antigen CD34 [Bombina bombina]|uniref:hematopoietic progenitor cell antigen CD34 n=1 Tax=Bombina bombina TaxID=8345 RepID=UPI00235AD0FB|nr:hematopoietic progenitor cell antigen CD34 [Bombina bombina]
MMLFCNLRAMKRRLVIWSLLNILTVLCTSAVDVDTNTTITPVDNKSPITATENIKETTTKSATIVTSITSQPSTMSTVHPTTAGSITPAKSSETSNRSTTESMQQTYVSTSTNTSSTVSDKPEETESSSQANATTATQTSTDLTISSAAVTSISHTAMITTTDRELEESTNVTTEMPLSIDCKTLRNQESTSQVVCLQYKEKINCDDLPVDKKTLLKHILCNSSIQSYGHCNLTLFSSEVYPNCILFPVALASEGGSGHIKKHHSVFEENGITLKWGQISDHQTKTQKTMIALVTSGVLLAALVLAGYFLSNKKSWSPGRQRLGEDYTETDTQGNTLVSVSTQGQEKPKSGNRENGAGQVVNVNTTNGHSNKKQGLSDTEL